MIKVLIIGCGNIAGGFDAERSSDNLPFTHAGAFSENGNFQILSCVDPDHNKRKSFKRRWSVTHDYEKIEEVFLSEQRYDVISVCSPTTAHYRDMLASIELKPRLIFCEKPVTPSEKETSELVERCKSNGILLVVNYTRRWDPDVKQLSHDIKNGKWGIIRSVTGIYTKGILNNGSHMIDVLHILLGKMDVISVGKPVRDYFSDDPSIPVILSGQNGISVQLSCGHAKDFSLFELQIVTEKGVISMENGGLTWRMRRVIESPYFHGYRSLDAGETKTGRLSMSTMAAVAEIQSVFTQDSELISSTGETALAAQKICEKVLKLSQSNDKKFT